VPTNVTFGSGNGALLASAPPENDPLSLLSEIGLEPGSPVIVLFGGAAGLSDEAQAQVARVVAPALVRAAEQTGAAIIDGGTASGVMACIGAASAARGRPLRLIGCAPAALVSYPGGSGGAGSKRVPLEPNHSHFVLAPGAEWGSETELLVALAEALAEPAPLVAVLAGGGEGALAEARAAVRRGWPLFFAEGTG
jgi:hypothetical protein